MKIEQFLLPFSLNDKGNIPIEVEIKGQIYIIEVTPKDVKHMKFLLENQIKE